MRKTRREFLTATAILGSGTGVIARALANQPPGEPVSSPPPTAPPTEQSPTPPVGPLPIAEATILEAEKLAGIEFTPAERAQMGRTLPEQIGMIRARQKLGPLPNDLAPAHVFDPRLPGMKFTENARTLVLPTTQAPLPSNDEDIAFAPLTLLSHWVKSRQITSRRLTDLYVSRLERLDAKLHAVITLTADHARAKADAADAQIAAGHYRGPLHGIPYAAKDLFDTAGIRTTWGAEPFKGRVPTKDATVIKLLDAAGAVLLAKTSLGALAYGDIWFDAQTKNPWKLEQGSSGSSAGSAAATAAGCVGFSIGTETYGSIMSPSMVCGTTGLRPTFGRVSRAGAMALCWSLDKVGPICRTVADAAIVLSAIHGTDDADPSTIAAPFSFDAGRSVNQLRVGYDRGWFDGEAADPIDRHALDVLKSLGVSLVDISLPDWPYEALLPILLTEAAAAFEDLTRGNTDDLLKWQADAAWPNTFRQAWFIPAIELVQSERFRRQVMTMMAERFEKIDAIFAPSQAANLCLITNMTGHPQLTLRAGFHEDGTPRGVTLWGRLFDEGSLCTLGMAMETSLDVWHKRPTV